MSKLKHYGTCVGIGGGITAFILCNLAALDAFIPFIYYLWVGFVSMIIYFSTGAHKDGKTYLKMILSFVCGIVWGQISNLIYVTVWPSSHLLASILDYGVLIFLLLWVHIAILGQTPFGFVPTVFLGLATTIGFFGRPFPYAGHGLVGDIPPFIIIGFQIAYLLFGLLFSIMIEVIADWCAKGILKPGKDAEPARDTESADKH